MIFRGRRHHREPGPARAGGLGHPGLYPAAQGGVRPRPASLSSSAESLLERFSRPAPDRPGGELLPLRHPPARGAAPRARGGGRETARQGVSAGEVTPKAGRWMVCPLLKGAVLTPEVWQERWTNLTHTAETLKGLPLEPRVVLAVRSTEEDRRSLAVAARTSVASFCGLRPGRWLAALVITVVEDLNLRRIEGGRELSTGEAEVGAEKGSKTTTLFAADGVKGLAARPPARACLQSQATGGGRGLRPACERGPRGAGGQLRPQAGGGRSEPGGATGREIARQGVSAVSGHQRWPWPCAARRRTGGAWPWASSTACWTPSRNG